MAVSISRKQARLPLLPQAALCPRGAILVVGAAEAARRALTEALESHRYSVIQESSEGNALAAARIFRFDACICDGDSMSNYSALAFWERMHGLQQEMSVVCCGDFPTEPVRVRLESEGCLLFHGSCSAEALAGAMDLFLKQKGRSQCFQVLK